MQQQQLAAAAAAAAGRHHAAAAAGRQAGRQAAAVAAAAEYNLLMRSQPRPEGPRPAQGPRAWPDQHCPDVQTPA